MVFLNSAGAGMVKNISCLVFILFIFFSLRAQSPVSGNILKNLQTKDKNAQQKEWVAYIANSFQNVTTGMLGSQKEKNDALLEKYNIGGKMALEYFNESIYQQLSLHQEDSKYYMHKAVQAAGKSNSDYLSHAFLNFLAYKETEEGNVIEAVSNYRMAKKYAVKLNDPRLELVTDVNISDVFYKNAFYKQSLSYLKQAENLSVKFFPNDLRIKIVIYYNKAENFFKMREIDSLSEYNDKLKKLFPASNRLFTYQNRTGYYLSLLHHDYKGAIAMINMMRRDKRFDFNDRDLQNLADAYYFSNQTDSARAIINRLLAKPSFANHPEIKLHLYDVLGRISEQQKDYKTAALDYKISLQQSEDNMSRITQVNSISSLIKVDELENYYSQKDQIYKREQILLILAIVFTLLIILIIAAFYSVVKQKRRYEKLLFNAEKEELAFINSHDVRRHLTNIMGLIEVLDVCKNKDEECTQVKKYLYSSVQELDKAIINISEKLDANL